MAALPFNLATQTLPFDDPSAATAAAYASLHGGRAMPSLDTHDEQHASVYVAALDGRDCAVKRLPGVRADSVRVVRWCRALAALPPHSNVVRPLHVAFTRGRAYLVMPYVHAYSLSEYRAMVYGNAPLPEEAVRLLSLDVLCGLYHLRLHHLAHRAVHPGNVFVDAHTGVARVTDLSYCAVLPQQQQQSGSNNSGGSVVAALSPEQQQSATSRAWADPAASNSSSSAVMSPATPSDSSSSTTTTPREQAYTTAAATTAAAAVTATDASHAMTAADVWGFGMILHAMCSNSGKPFAYNSSSNSVDAMVAREYAGTTYSDDLYDLLRACLQPDPHKRPSLFALFQHRFVFPGVLITLEATRVQAQAQADGLATGATTASDVAAGLVSGAGAAVSRVTQQMRDAGVAGSVGWALSSLRERASAVMSSLMTPSAQEATLLAQIRPGGGEPQLPRQPHVHDDVDTNSANNDSNKTSSASVATPPSSSSGATMHHADDNDHHGNDSNAHMAPHMHTSTPAAATTAKTSNTTAAAADAARPVITTTTATTTAAAAAAAEHNTPKTPPS